MALFDISSASNIQFCNIKITAGDCDFLGYFFKCSNTTNDIKIEHCNSTVWTSRVDDGLLFDGHSAAISKIVVSKNRSTQGTSFKYLSGAIISENDFSGNTAFYYCTDCNITNNILAGDDSVWVENSDRNSFNLNRFFELTLTNTSDKNNVCNNRYDNAITNLGAGNTVADNTVY
jgi:hypothetical protein